jgi:hypothetical protein
VPKLPAQTWPAEVVSRTESLRSRQDYERERQRARAGLAETEQRIAEGQREKALREQQARDAAAGRRLGQWVEHEHQLDEAERRRHPGYAVRVAEEALAEARRQRLEAEKAKAEAEQERAGLLTQLKEALARKLLGDGGST